jgi:hypothetical protein
VTLDQFIAAADARPQLPNNSYVREPGLHMLYVRLGARYINGIKYPRVLDLANFSVVSHLQRKGRFTRFLQRLQRDYPTLIIFMENVLNPWLPAKLPLWGFELVPGTDPLCFVRWGSGWGPSP